MRKFEDATGSERIIGTSSAVVPGQVEVAKRAARDVMQRNK